MKLKLPTFKLPSLRTVASLCSVICLGLLCFAVYLQSVNGLEPCPLCVIQRILIFLVGLVFLLGALHISKKPWRVFHNTLIVFFSFLGMLAASRQVSLEHLPPDQVPPCGPTFNYILTNLPFREALSSIFSGSAECAKVTWRFLDLSIPTWTLMFFILFALIGIFQALRE